MSSQKVLIVKGVLLLFWNSQVRKQIFINVSWLWRREIDIFWLPISNLTCKKKFYFLIGSWIRRTRLSTQNQYPSLHYISDKSNNLVPTSHCNQWQGRLKFWQTIHNFTGKLSWLQTASFNALSLTEASVKGGQRGQLPPHFLAE